MRARTTLMIGNGDCVLGQPSRSLIIALGSILSLLRRQRRVRMSEWSVPLWDQGKERWFDFALDFLRCVALRCGECRMFGSW